MSFLGRLRARRQQGNKKAREELATSVWPQMFATEDAVACPIVKCGAPMAVVPNRYFLYGACAYAVLHCPECEARGAV